MRAAKAGQSKCCNRCTPAPNARRGTGQCRKSMPLFCSGTRHGRCSRDCFALCIAHGGASNISPRRTRWRQVEHAIAEYDATPTGIEDRRVHRFDDVRMTQRTRIRSPTQRGIAHVNGIALLRVQHPSVGARRDLRRAGIQVRSGSDQDPLHCAALMRVEE